MLPSFALVGGKRGTKAVTDRVFTCQYPKCAARAAHSCGIGKSYQSDRYLDGWLLCRSHYMTVRSMYLYDRNLKRNRWWKSCVSLSDDVVREEAESIGFSDERFREIDCDDVMNAVDEALLDCLSRRDAFIVSERLFGSLKLWQVGNRTAISRERVRQVEIAGYEKLKWWLRSHRPDLYLVLCEPGMERDRMEDQIVRRRVPELE